VAPDKETTLHLRNRLRTLPLPIFLLLFTAARHLAGESAPAPISTLAWLSGSWSGEKDGVASEEHWTGATGDGLVGMHKDVKAGKMIGFEFLRIEVDAQGRVCYISMPGGAPPTSFCAIEITDRRVVFENRAHDFPQRILYWLDAAGNLHARIEGPLEGPVDGTAAAIDWVWSRMPG
jgi:hypothetical protein